MTAATANPTSTAMARSRRVRLLVADDSRIARESVVAYLHNLHQVEISAVVENGRLAVETALRNEPDLVLLDLQMPVMSGLEAAGIFRNSMPHVGVILTSVHDHRELRAACLSGGADAFIAKGAIPTTFPTVLAEVLALVRSPARHRRAPRFTAELPADRFTPPSRPARAEAHTPAILPGRAAKRQDNAPSSHHE